jgi:transcriptional regulator with XRE-family HTH domain
MEKTGDRLKRIRKELGIKQGDFAARIGLKQGSYSDIENEKEILTDRNMKLICLEFGVNMDWLRHGGDGPAFKNQELAPDERELLDLYEKLVPENRKEVRDYTQEKLELQEFRARAGAETPSKQPPGGATKPLEPPQEERRADTSKKPV